MKKIGVLVSGFVFVAMSSWVHADVVSFTPSGTSTVPQGTSLYWDMESSATSTSSFGAVGDFYLSDHGDFHFDPSAGASMVRVGTTEGGALLSPGTPIDAGSNWETSNGFVGTTDYDGTMVPPQTAYFGLRFQLAGETHYGWVQITEGTTDQSVLAWAYESAPDVAIAAGATDAPAPAPGAAAPIPTMSSYGLVLTMLGLLLVASRRLRTSGRR